jgi:precorrin-2 dehydrogenase/sirohydrochlorin ferrochelatase
MRYFPINLDIHGRPVVVVGGGAVAARKCSALLEAGAIITVIAPAFGALLRAMHDQRKITCLARQFTRGDLAGAFLVFAATDNDMVNQAVAAEARDRAILADVADAPGLGTFTMPAVVQRGELQLTVSTGGASPALARRIREELEGRYGTEYAIALELLARLREKLLTEKGNNAYNKKLLSALVGHDLPALFKTGSIIEINHLLTKLFGPGSTLAELEVREKDTA